MPQITNNCSYIDYFNNQINITKTVKMKKQHMIKYYPKGISYKLTVKNKIYYMSIKQINIIKENNIYF